MSLSLKTMKKNKDKYKNDKQNTRKQIYTLLFNNINKEYNKNNQGLLSCKLKKNE